MRNWLCITFGIFVFCGCSRSLHNKEEIESYVDKSSFFCPNARYYGFIDFDNLKDLIRLMSYHFDFARKLQFRILRQRTRHFSFYARERFYSFLLQGSFPKIFADELLLRHPAWLKFGFDIDGYHHYNSLWKIGVPKSHTILITTDDLAKLYQGCYPKWQDFFPFYVVSKFRKYPFIIYYPNGQEILEYYERKFLNVPSFNFLAYFSRKDKENYFVSLELLFKNNENADYFRSELNILFAEYKDSNKESHTILSMLDLTQEEKKLSLVAVYDVNQTVKLVEVILDFFHFRLHKIFNFLSEML